MKKDENRQRACDRRAFLRAAGRTVAALAAVGVTGPRLWAGRQEKSRRNIVLVLSDDHRYDFMGFMDGAP